jgi:hypothetical protein
MANSRCVGDVSMLRRNAFMRAVDDFGGRRSPILSASNNHGSLSLHEVGVYQYLLRILLTPFASPILGRIKRDSLSIRSGWLLSIWQPFSTHAIAERYSWKCPRHCFDTKLNSIHSNRKSDSSVITEFRVSRATANNSTSSIA